MGRFGKLCEFGCFKKFRVDYSVIPWCTFTEPEVAHVGINETQAQAENIEYEVTRFDIAELDRAIADGEAHGIIKVLTIPGKDKIKRFHFKNHFLIVVQYLESSSIN